MIETKDLIEYVRGDITNSDLHKEYIREIAARLKAFDKLKEALEKMVERLGEK